MATSMLSQTSGAVMLAITLFCCSSCSKNAEGVPEPSVQSAAVAQSHAGLIAAQALFEAGQLEEALARLDASDPNHAELRGQVEQELARRRSIEAFDSWSVGPGKIKRSPKKTQRLCERRGGSWIVVDNELRICNEEGKLAVIRVRDGKNVHLTGMYTADYVTLRNQTLYENELRLLRESFGEPHRQNDDPTGAGEWQVPGDRTIRLSRTKDGDVFLAVGLASGFSDDPGAFAEAVHGALAKHYQRSEAESQRRRVPSVTASQLRAQYRNDPAATRSLYRNRFVLTGWIVSSAYVDGGLSFELGPSHFPALLVLVPETTETSRWRNGQRITVMCGQLEELNTSVLRCKGV